MNIALPGARAAMLGFMFGSQPGAFPWVGASADLDFIRRQYRWNNASRTEADFTTLILNGATWGAQGLDFSSCTINPNVTITLAALGLAMPPCVFAFAGYFLSAPATTKSIVTIDDGTAAERFFLGALATPIINLQTLDGNVSQASQNPGAIAPAPGVRFGLAYSVDLNDVKAAANGIDAPADTVATMPTVTTLRLGAGIPAGSFPPVIMSRLVIFAAVKTQAEVNLLSAQIRDAA
jgi:hypothetical protein